MVSNVIKIINPSILIKMCINTLIELGISISICKYFVVLAGPAQCSSKIGSRLGRQISNEPVI